MVSVLINGGLGRDTKGFSGFDFAGAEWISSALGDSGFRFSSGRWLARQGPSSESAPPTAAEPAWPRALAEAIAPQPNVQPQAAAPSRPAPSSHELQKLRVEIARLELLVKKLQTELQIERQYNQALETQIQTLTRIE